MQIVRPAVQLERLAVSTEMPVGMLVAQLELRSARVANTHFVGHEALEPMLYVRFDFERGFCCSRLRMTQAVM
jgi:hypothetical protein